MRLNTPSPRNHIDPTTQQTETMRCKYDEVGLDRQPKIGNIGEETSTNERDMVPNSGRREGGAVRLESKVN